MVLVYGSGVVTVLNKQESKNMIMVWTEILGACVRKCGNCEVLNYSMVLCGVVFRERAGRETQREGEVEERGTRLPEAGYCCCTEAMPANQTDLKWNVVEPTMSSA